MRGMGEWEIRWGGEQKFIIDYYHIDSNHNFFFTESLKESK